MLAGLTRVGTVQTPSRSAVTGQYSVTYSSTSDVRMELVPMRGRAFLTSLGNLPSNEVFEAFVDGNVTIDVHYRIVLNSVTYEILSIETFGDFISPTHHRCVVRRLGDK